MKTKTKPSTWEDSLVTIDCMFPELTTFMGNVALYTDYLFENAFASESPVLDGKVDSIQVDTCEFNVSAVLINMLFM